MPSTPPIKVPIIGEDRTARAIRSAETNIRGFGRTAGSILGGLGVGMSVSALVGFSRTVIEYGSSLTDAAAATNTNVEALQVLRYLAQEAGASQQNLDNALVRVQKSAIDASNGLATYTRAFDTLGINVNDFIQLPTERKLEAVARAVSNADNQQAAYAAAMDILGARNAPKLMEVLDKLSSSYDSAADAAKRDGQIMSEDTAKQMDQAADALARMQTRIKNMWGSALGDAAVGIEGWFSFLKNYTGNFEAADLLSPLAHAFDSFNKVIQDNAINIIDSTAAKKENAQAQKELNETISAASQLLEENSAQMRTVTTLMTKLSWDRVTPERKYEILSQQADGLRDKLRILNWIGKKGTEEWADATAELLNITIQLESIERQRTASVARAAEQYSELVKEHEDLFKTDAQKISDLRSEINALSDALQTLDPNSEDWYKTASERMQKMIDLQQRLREESADIGSSRQQELNRLLGNTSAGGNKPAASGPRTSTHLMADYSNAAFASPWAGAAQTAGTAVNPVGTTAVETVKTGVSTATTALDEIAELITNLATEFNQRLQTLSAQVANAR